MKRALVIAASLVVALAIMVVTSYAVARSKAKAIAQPCESLLVPDGMRTSLLLRDVDGTLDPTWLFYFWINGSPSPLDSHAVVMVSWRGQVTFENEWFTLAAKELSNKPDARDGL